MKNELIEASAGTGKTYALVERLVAALREGVEPCEIVALTFSRAAAGEIFARFVRRLAENAAQRPADADLLRSDDGAKRALTAAFRQAKNREACRSFIATYQDLVGTWHRLYLDHPDAAGWGDAARIWPEPPEALAARIARDAE